MTREPEAPRPRRFTDDAVDAAILAGCAAARRPIAPDDVAKALDPEHWRQCLRQVRRRAQALSEAGRIEILRKGKPVPAELMKGIVRLRLPP